MNPAQYGLGNRVMPAHRYARNIVPNLPKYKCGRCNTSYYKQNDLLDHVHGPNWVANPNGTQGCSAPITNPPIVKFCEDGINNLTMGEIIQLTRIDSPEGGSLIEFLIRTVNFNPNKPRHHNILYTNLHSSAGYLYTGQEWSFKVMKREIYRLIDAKVEDLRVLLQTAPYLDEKTKAKIRDTIAVYYNPLPIGKDCTDERPETRERKKLAASVRRLLYYYRYVVTLVEV